MIDPTLERSRGRGWRRGVKIPLYVKYWSRDPFKYLLRVLFAVFNIASTFFEIQS